MCISRSESVKEIARCERAEVEISTGLDEVGVRIALRNKVRILHLAEVAIVDIARERYTNKQINRRKNLEIFSQMICNVLNTPRRARSIVSR